MANAAPLYCRGNRKALSAELTGRQAQILQVVKDHYEATGIPPTIREIGIEVGLNSSSTVHSHLKTLTKKGYLRHEDGTTRNHRLVSRVDWREVEELLQSWIHECPSCPLADNTLAMIAKIRGVS